MWSVEHTIEADIAADAIWRAWADVDRWPEWNDDIQRIEWEGPFAAGSSIRMTPHGQGEVELLITDAVPGRRFVDQAEVAGTTIRTTHEIEASEQAGMSRITYRLEASGGAAEQLGPAISADFPQTLAALVRFAAA